MEKKTEREGASSGALRLIKYFPVFTLCSRSPFFLRTPHVSGHGAWRSTRTLVTVLTALTIHLSEAKNVCVAF